MAPFGQASETRFLYFENGGVGTYAAAADPEWTVGT